MAAKKVNPSTPTKNPLTGKAPNSYTATDQPLSEPRRVRPVAPAPAVTTKERSRRQEFEASGGGAPEIGYNKPSDMSHSDFYWMMGQHKDRGPTTTNINTPHPSDPGIVVNRRREDLSGQEHARGLGLLKKHGTDYETVKRDIGNSMDRSVASSVKAGAPRPAGQLFYGGTDEKGAKSFPVQRVDESVQRLVSNKQFPASGEATKDHALARAMMTVSNAKTSPNVPFRSEHPKHGSYSPNNMAAESAAHAGIEHKDPPAPTKIGADLVARGADVPKVGVGVYKANMAAATNATGQLAAGVTTRELRHASGNVMFDPTAAPKTTDYQAAHQDPDGPDQKTVVDIHEGTNAFPHLSTEKAHVHVAVDAGGEIVRHGGEVYDGHVISEGKPTKIEVHPDEYGPKGQLPKRAKAALPGGATGWKRGRDPNDDSKFLIGKSRVENVLAEGKNVVNAMVDHAARAAHTERGMAPSVDSAQFVHRGQASRWSQRQIERPDLPQSIESEYSLPKPHEHMWSSAAEMHDAMRADEMHPDMHVLTTMSDYNSGADHPWAGHSAPKHTIDQSPDVQTPDELAGKTLKQAYQSRGKG